MVALWQQRWRNHSWRTQRWSKIGALAVALVAALWLANGEAWTPAIGQESPLAESSPLAAPVSVALPSISGAVSNLEGEPLAGLVVTAYRRQQQRWVSARQTTTDVAGAYRFPWLPAGTYRLYINDPQDLYAGLYAATYYPDAGDIEDATDIVLAGASVAGLDAEIAAGGQITGTLTWPEGPTPFDSTIELYRVTSAPITTQLTARDDLGLAPALRQVRLVASEKFTQTIVSYDFNGLAAGRYRVCAKAISLRSTLHECFDDVALGIHATDVVVTPGAIVGDVAIALGDGADFATLAGNVTLEDGTPVSGIDVEIIPAPNVDFFAVPRPNSTTTNEAGNFRADELPYGEYRIRFRNAEGLYFASDYRETAEATEPTVVALDRGDTLTLTAVVSAAAQITGLVTIDGAIAGLSGQVSAYTMTEAGWASGGTGNIVAATGVYTIAGLRGGSYQLQASVGLPGQIIYGGQTLETAAAVEVMTGTITGGANFDLTPYLANVAYGRISGMVLRDGVPQPDMLVRIYEAGFDCCMAPPPMLALLSDEAGRFEVEGLPPGQYKVGVSPPDQPYPTLYAPDQRAFATATAYIIGNPADGVARQVIEDVNVSLGAVGSVARRVLRPDDSPLVGARIDLYQRIGEVGQFPLVGSTQTDEEGRYRFVGLVPDLYHLCIVSEGIAEPSCSGRGGAGVGIDVAVSDGQETTGIDIVDVP